MGRYKHGTEVINKDDLYYGEWDDETGYQTEFVPAGTVGWVEQFDQDIHGCDGFKKRPGTLIVFFKGVEEFFELTRHEVELAP